MIGWLKHLFSTSVGAPAQIDFAPLNTTPKTIEGPTIDNPKAPPAPPDWNAKLKEAAARAGKPFKCAADGIPREVIVDGKPVDIARVRGANVTKIADRKRKS